MKKENKVISFEQKSKTNKQGFEKHSRLGVISKAHSGFWHVPKNQIYSGIADSSQTRKGLSSRPVVPEQATGWKRLL